jgi:hypothetical protein
MMKRYESAEEFTAVNEELFSRVQAGASMLKSPSQLSQTGMPLQEAERLSYLFLDLLNVCTNLQFGLSSSALNAKASLKKCEAIGYREADGRVKDKEFAAVSSDSYMEFTKNFNDLSDINEYLKQKRENFEKAHFYYKNLMGSK